MLKLAIAESVQDDPFDGHISTTGDKVASKTPDVVGAATIGGRK
jgi:hypothetical protein